ncbi:RNA-binding protein Cwf29 [Lecanora helva]
MNTIREIQNLNKRELEAGVSTEASWHADYRDTAYIYIGGLPFDLSEGDVLTIFSQYGEPTYVNLIRDKESGKSKGFAFLKYEDQRSTDLAVDNLGGATVMGRVLKVDHTRYKRKDGEEEEEREREMLGANGAGESDGDEHEMEQRPMLKEEIELQKLIRDHDEDDPMKEYLVKEKREEVANALKKAAKGEGKRKHHHRHHHRHRSNRRSKTPESGGERKQRHERHRRKRSRSP